MKNSERERKREGEQGKNKKERRWRRWWWRYKRGDGQVELEEGRE